MTGKGDWTAKRVGKCDLCEEIRFRSFGSFGLRQLYCEISQTRYTPFFWLSCQVSKYGI